MQELFIADVLLAYDPVIELYSGVTHGVPYGLFIDPRESRDVHPVIATSDEIELRAVRPSTLRHLAKAHHVAHAVTHERHPVEIRNHQLISLPRLELREEYGVRLLLTCKPSPGRLFRDELKEVCVGAENHPPPLPALHPHHAALGTAVHLVRKPAPVFPHAPAIKIGVDPPRDEGLGRPQVARPDRSSSDHAD